MWQRVAVRHGREFVKHVLPRVMKPMRALWNEVIGFVFLCFTVFLGLRTVTLARSGHMVGLIFCGFGTLLTLWYGIDAFLRARRISRS